MDQVDAIAFPDKPFRSGRDCYLAEMDPDLLTCLKAEGRIGYRRLIHKWALDAYLKIGVPFNWKMDSASIARFAALREHYAGLPPVCYYDHHLAHAAAAYFTSGLDHAAIVTMDWSGGPYATAIWKARGRRIIRMQAEPHTNSLGKFYSDCTLFLGLSHIPDGETIPSDFAEGKTMGLASYGGKNVCRGLVSSLLDTTGSRWYRYLTPPSEEVLGFPPGSRERVLDQPYPDFAAAVQDALERAVERVVRSALESAKTQALCLGGGVSLNCSSNGSLRASGKASPIWIFPAAGDAGLSVGAAMVCAAESGELPPSRLNHVYLGPDFSRGECATALSREARVAYTRANNVAEEVARCLAAGQIVGWFQGRMEMGPRALGNRSILADPRTLEMRHRVNRLKGRELWRPLAPVVLAEHASEFFVCDGPSPFMLFRTQVRPEKRPLVPAIVHVDGSSRPQTVTRDQNAPLYELIAAFARHTAIPMLLNTSFNSGGEPIVCSPEDAIQTFLAARLDLLVLGDIMVRARSAEGRAFESPRDCVPEGIVS